MLERAAMRRVSGGGKPIRWSGVARGGRVERVATTWTLKKTKRKGGGRCKALDTSTFNAIDMPFKCYEYELLETHNDDDDESSSSSSAAYLPKTTAEAEEPSRLSRDAVGLALAALIFLVWLATLPLMFAQPGSMVPNVFTYFGGPPALGSKVFTCLSTAVLMLCRTWVTTGLFVTTHDAIHFQVCPTFQRLNHLIGAVCAFCYASFSYKRLFRDHWRHHARPITEEDPDWYRGGLAKWLSSFMGHYSTFWQLFWESFQFWSFVAIGFRLLGIEFSHMVVRVALIWALPALISGMQLFYFGTYLPHKDNPDSAFSARSNNWPYFLSLLSCFHFGACHEEHHAFPSVPWWGLPSVRAKGLAAQVHSVSGHSHTLH